MEIVRRHHIVVIIIAMKIITKINRELTSYAKLKPKQNIQRTKPKMPTNLIT